MSSIELQRPRRAPAGPLFDLYERYVGEPRSRKDVYGYWTFIVGYVLGLAGVVVFVVGTSPAEPALPLREVSVTLAALGLALALFGFGLFLPMRRRGMQASVVGLGVALSGVAWFVVVYPGSWLTDVGAAVISVYTAGIAIVAGVAALVPVVTGERGLLVDDASDVGSHPPALVGETPQDALFTVYPIGTGEWTWRIIKQDAVAENAATALSRPDAEAVVEAVKAKIREAGLLEITTAAFRLYENEAGRWGWLLMRDDGSLVAESGAAFPDRDRAETSVNVLKERGPDAPVIDIEGAAFDRYEAGGGWHWRLLDEERTSLAVNASPFDDPTSADAATEAFAGAVDGARVLGIDALGVELYEADGAWRWRAVDADDEVLAAGTDDYPSRRGAESAVDRLFPLVSSATAVDADAPRYDVFEDEAGAWRFRLVDGDETLALSRGERPTLADARTDASRVAETAADADVIEIDGAEYELYPDGDGWRWRLVTADREVVADSTERHVDREAAAAAVERVRRRALEADFIEFEHAAFQQYEADTGEWRWRLIDEDGHVMADSGEDYATPEEVAAAMTTLKENAPNAEIIAIDAAAFEFYRDDAGRWGWRLVDETGAVVAEGASRYSSREDARGAVDALIEYTSDAAVRAMERAAFQVHTDGRDEWRWRFVHPDGAVVAVGTSTGATRDEIEETLESVRAAADGADVHDVGAITVERYHDGGWRFRLLDRDRSPVAESAGSYETREAVDDAISAFRAGADDPTVFAIDRSAVRLVEADGGWRWELIDGDRTVLAASPEPYADRERAVAAVERARDLAPDAGRVDFEAVAFELYRDDGWRWRLIRDREVAIAASASGYDSRADARDALRTMTEIVADSSVLEIDDAAFELHRDDGGWRWRLVDENGQSLAQSVESHYTRQEVRAAMDSVKRHAPEGWLTIAE